MITPKEAEYRSKKYQQAQINLFDQHCVSELIKQWGTFPIIISLDKYSWEVIKAIELDLIEDGWDVKVFHDQLEVSPRPKP